MKYVVISRALTLSTAKSEKSVKMMSLRWKNDDMFKFKIYKVFCFKYNVIFFSMMDGYRIQTFNSEEII